MRRIVIVVALLVGSSITPAQAVHWYRGPGSGCTPADGALTDQQASGPVTANVMMLHNTFNDVSNGTPVTVINAGEAVRWTWNSSHCHSAKSSEQGLFYSGYHYPTTAPGSPQVVPGFFEYPVPTDQPTLSYTHTFATPGVFTYSCEHHAAIGMAGVVVVQ